MSEYRTSGPDGLENTGTVERAKGAAADTVQTAKVQARNVGSEMKGQAGQAVDRMRGRVRDEADAQSRRAAQGVRQWADDLVTMSDNGKPDSPVQGVLKQAAGTGHRAADYLEERGLGGVATDIQSFARRRPAVFLLGALAAGFVAARVAKAGTKVAQEDLSGSDDLPRRTTQPRPAAPMTDHPDHSGTSSPYAAGPTSAEPYPTGPTSAEPYSSGPISAEPYQPVTRPADHRGGEPR